MRPRRSSTSSRGPFANAGSSLRRSDYGRARSHEVPRVQGRELGRVVLVEAETPEAHSPPRVHLTFELDDGIPAAPDLLPLEAARGEDDKGVEHFVVQSRRFREGVVAASDRLRETPAEGRIVREM